MDSSDYQQGKGGVHDNLQLVLGILSLVSSTGALIYLAQYSLIRNASQKLLLINTLVDILLIGDKGSVFADCSHVERRIWRSKSLELV